MAETDEATPATKKGRPAGKRGTFTFRVTAGLRARLEADAAVVGRPVSEEIERRLERSYENTDLLLSYFGSSETLKLSQAIANLIRTVEAETGNKWSEDSETKGHVNIAINRFMKIYFHEQGDAMIKTGMTRLDTPPYGLNAAEQVAMVMGLNSRAQEEMDALLKSPEGRAAWDRLIKRFHASPDAGT